MLPDIILYAKEGPNEEMRYAIRTWCKNLEFGRLCAVGGPFPSWFQPDILIENPRTAPTMEQCYRSLIKALSDDSLSQQVIIMMDDVFILRPVGVWRENSNRNTLMRQIENMSQGTLYSQLVENTSIELARIGKPTLSFEEHAPFVCDRSKLLELLTSYGEKKIATLLWRSLYGNIYGIPTHYRFDVKLRTRTVPLPNKTIVSTDDQSWAGAAGIAIRDWFPKPSKYEK